MIPEAINEHVNRHKMDIMTIYNAAQLETHNKIYYKALKQSIKQHNY